LSSKASAIWLDERELKVGDSIIQGISEGLKDTDYVVVVLSKSSIKSNWVQAELNSALMHQISDKGRRYCRYCSKTVIFPNSDSPGFGERERQIGRNNCATDHRGLTYAGVSKKRSWPIRCRSSL
jgi:hypothetical protein